MSNVSFHAEQFDAPELLDTLLISPPDVLDTAPFGIIEMSDASIVQFYNRFEEELAGLVRDDVIGRDFFIDVAPCTNNFMVRERFVDAWDRGVAMDEVIPYTFSYRMKATRVRLRMIVHERRGWLLVSLHV